MDLREHLSSSSVSPQKILKIVIGFSVVLLVMWLFLISRMDYTGSVDPQNEVAQARADSIRTLIGQQSPASSGMEEDSPDIFMNAFTTFLVLIVILGGVWFWSRNRTKSGDIQASREIDGHILGQGAQLKIVEINEEIWVLGVTSDTVNLLHRYPKDEWNESLEEPEMDQSSFYKLFSSSNK